MKTRRFGFFAAPLLVSALSLFGFQEHHHSDGQAAERLGTVSFPSSCFAAVQPLFIRGVALLHSFGYEPARKVFEQIEAEEPSCAMAYWGEAMTYYHQLWDRPSPADLAKGWALVQKAQAAGPKTAREQGYIAAMAAFYRDDAKESFESRSAAYIEALDQLHQLFPNDHEAAIFYALSLLGSPHASDNDFADRKKAVSILNAVLKDEPDHPGVAHYLIHACDNRAARSAEAAGKPESAQLYYQQLLANCPDGDRPELAHARTYLKAGSYPGDPDRALRIKRRA